VCALHLLHLLLLLLLQASLLVHLVLKAAGSQVSVSAQMTSGLAWKE
jgi:hypothetical protein